MRKILTIFILFFIFFPKVFSFEADLTFDREKVKFWETVKLSLNIKNIEDFENLEILEINLDKNFEIIWKQQSSKTSIQSKVIDWKIEEKRDILANLNFILQPKKVWLLETWPMILSDWNQKIEIKSVKIEVLENEIKNIILEEKKETLNETKLYDKWIFFLILLFSLFIIFLIFFKRKKIEEKKSEDNVEEEKKEILELPPTIDYLLELDNEKFIFEFEKILKIKMEKKTKLTLEDENILAELSLSLNKLKYSEIKVDKREILELLNKF